MKYLQKTAPGIFYLAIPPLIIALFAAFLFLVPGVEAQSGRTTIRTLRVQDFPLALVLEQNDGEITSAWLRTPAGSQEIEQAEGLSFVSDNALLSRVDQDAKDDLLWRVSFTNFEGIGNHIWIGMTTWNPKVHVISTPYHYARWDAVPAKLVVPKGTAVYVAPATPTYQKASPLSGKDNYSFIYTMRMTPEGPAFVPVPSVYRQLAILLRAGIQGEFAQTKRLAYVRMLTEFNSLAEGRPPQAETLLNFQHEKIATLSWKR